ALPERIGARALPAVDVIDLRSAPRVAEARGIPWTEPLDHAVRGALARAEQVILLLNRRGFATYLQCPACGDVRDCPHCAIAHTGLHLPDFRAAERTFQLVAQVAGRAGRGPKGGRVFVQTRAPDHPAIRAAAAHSVAGFAAAELPLRAPPNPAYPPHVGLARFVAVHEDERLAQAAAEGVAAWLRRANTECLGGALTVLGPAPCPIMRLKGRWRWHV